MKDTEVIQKYHNWISWADKTTSRNIWIAGLGIKTVMLTDIAFHIPTHHAQVLAVLQLPGIWSCANFLNRRPVLLVWGNPNEEETERIWWQSMRTNGFLNDKEVGLHVSFINARAKLTEGRLYVRYLDGMDFVRTIKKLSIEGSEAKPVWVWDE